LITGRIVFLFLMRVGKVLLRRLAGIVHTVKKTTRCYAEKIQGQRRI
jgi:hypothetical protein